MYDNTSREITAEELHAALAGALQLVLATKGAGYLEQPAQVIEVLVTYGVTNYSADPVRHLNYGDDHVKEVTGLVSGYLRHDYTGPANFGILDRTRRLNELAGTAHLVGI